MDLRSSFNAVDSRLLGIMDRYGITLLRSSLGVVFIWFGLLKVIGASPVVQLVADTVYFVSPTWFVPFLGFWEVAVGVGLLLGWFLRLTLLLFWLQLAGTFLVLVLQPQVAFQAGNPLLLTVEGEFVVKNLVLITAGLVVGTTVQRRDRNGLG